MAKLLFLPAAEEDYSQALEWYRTRSTRAATGFESGIEVALSGIADAPEQWPSCDDRHRFYVMRRYPYSIIYRITADDVLIVAFAHSSRDAGYWADRD